MNDMTTQAVAPKYAVFGTPVVNASALIFDPLPLAEDLSFREAFLKLQHLRRGDAYQDIHIRQADGTVMPEATILLQAVIEPTFDKWSNPSELRLRGGEMTAQEVRTVQAVLNAVKADLKRELG